MKETVINLAIRYHISSTISFFVENTLVTFLYRTYIYIVKVAGGFILSFQRNKLKRLKKSELQSNGLSQERTPEEKHIFLRLSSLEEAWYLQKSGSKDSALRNYNWTSIHSSALVSGLTSSRF